MNRVAQLGWRAILFAVMLNVLAMRAQAQQQQQPPAWANTIRWDINATIANDRPFFANGDSSLDRLVPSGTLSGFFVTAPVQMTESYDPRLVRRADLLLLDRDFSFRFTAPLRIWAGGPTFVEQRSSNYTGRPSLYFGSWDGNRSWELSGQTWTLTHDSLAPNARYTRTSELLNASGSLSTFGTWGTMSIGGTAVSSHVPADVIVVITHGMQPSNTLYGLPEIRSAVAERWLNDTANTQQLAVLYWTWTRALCNGISLPNYAAVRQHTDDEGRKLARELNEYVSFVRSSVNPNYTPRIHMIGHSLGTLVNAEAVRLLMAGLKVEQFTILDAPLAPGNGQYGDLFCHETFFYDRLPESRVDYVDNYIAMLPPVACRFGQPIPGAGPPGTLGGAVIFNTCHSSVPMEYARFIRGERQIAGSSWMSPLLNNSSLNPRWSTSSGRCAVDWRLIETLDVALGGVTQLNATSYQLTTASPAAIGKRNFAVLPDTQSLRFEYQTLDTNGELSVRLGTYSLWRLPTSSASSGWQTALVPLGYLQGVTGDLVVRIDPVGTSSSSVIVRNLAVSRLASGCDDLDFNNDTLTPDSGDLDDFVAVLAGGPTACSTFPAPGCNDLDFNNDGLFPDSGDLDAFLSRLAGGPCV